MFNFKGGELGTNHLDLSIFLCTRHYIKLGNFIAQFGEMFCTKIILRYNYLLRIVNSLPLINWFNIYNCQWWNISYTSVKTKLLDCLMTLVFVSVDKVTNVYTITMLVTLKMWIYYDHTKTNVIIYIIIQC